jgi:hypothetical protein
MADLALLLQNGQHVPIKRDWRAGRERGDAPEETGDQAAHVQTCISLVVEGPQHISNYTSKRRKAGKYCT